MYMSINVYKCLEYLASNPIGIPSFDRQITDQIIVLLIKSCFALAPGVCKTFIADRRVYTDTSVLHESPQSLRTQKSLLPIGDDPSF